MGLETAGDERSLLKFTKQNKLSNSGHKHVLWKSGDNLEKEFIQDTVPGSRVHGRCKMIWTECKQSC